MYEQAWAAGFFDGEGCFSVSKRGYAVCMITQNDTEALLRFKDVVGVGRVSEGRVTKHGNEEFQYRVFGYNNVQHIVCTLWKNLSGPKRAQATYVLKVAGAACIERQQRKLVRQPRHGTISMYTKRDNPCRCDRCRAAWAEYARNNR